MFNLIFDVDYEMYCFITNKTELLSTKEFFLFPFKISINLFVLALVFTAPIASMFFLAHLIDSL